MHKTLVDDLRKTSPRSLHLIVKLNELVEEIRRNAEEQVTQTLITTYDENGRQYRITGVDRDANLIAQRAENSGEPFRINLTSGTIRNTREAVGLFRGELDRLRNLTSYKK